MRKKRCLVVTTMVLCALVIVSVVFGYRGVQQKKQVEDLLELGNQYLKEEQYEEAIVVYKQLLAIEPKEDTARENIVVAAVEWSDDLIEVHEYDKAEAVIMDVYSIVQDQRLEAKRQEITDKRDAYKKEQLEIKKKEEEHAQALEQINDSLSELAKICSAGDDDAIFNYMEGATYQMLRNSEYVEFDKKYETENGTLGLYEGGNYLYVGDYEGETRSGKGAWYSVVKDLNNQYCEWYVTRGEWSNDKPNGKQIAIYRDRKEDDSDRHTYEGNVSDGYWNGEVVIRYGEKGHDWVVTFNMGYAAVLGVDDHGEIISQIFEGGEYSNLYTDSASTRQEGIMGFS